MPRRKRTVDEIYNEYIYLRGREIVFDVDSRQEWGRVVDIEVDSENSVPVLLVEFPRSGRKQVPVIGKRTPRGLVGEKNVLRLHLDQQPGPFSWSSLDLGPSRGKPPVPTAELHVDLPLQTWTQMAKRKKPQVAQAFGETLADSIDSALESWVEAADSAALPPRVATSVSSTARSGDWFDVRIDISLYDCTAEQAHAAHTKLTYLLDSASDDDDARWSFLGNSPEYRRVLVTAFSLTGVIAGEELAVIKRRFLLR